MNERGVRKLLRRLKYAAPGLKTVAWFGPGRSAFEAAAAAEGLVPAEREAEGVVFWPDDSVSGEREAVSTRTRAVVVVAPEVNHPPLPHELSCRPATTSISLRQWVGRWFPEGSFLGGLAARVLVSPAVGDRPCSARLPGLQEWIFLREPSDRPPAEGELWKAAAVTFLGVGSFPIMPATLASALLIPAALGLHWAGVLFPISLAIAVLATWASVALEKWAGDHFLSEDPREFVLDEVAGQFLVWAMMPPDAGILGIFAGFFLFRLFDIFKWGVHWCEKLPFPGKIVWDDLLAGFYAGLVILLGAWILS